MLRTNAAYNGLLLRLINSILSGFLLFYFSSRTTFMQIQIAKSSGVTLITFLPHKRGGVLREFEHALALSKQGPAGALFSQSLITFRARHQIFKPT